MTNIVIPSNPADLKALRDGIKEISNSMARADGERDYQKEAVAELSEKFGVEKKHIKRMAVDYHKDSFDKKISEVEDYQQLYESVMTSTFTTVPDEDEDED